MRCRAVRVICPKCGYEYETSCTQFFCPRCGRGGGGRPSPFPPFGPFKF